MRIFYLKTTCLVMIIGALLSANVLARESTVAKKTDRQEESVRKGRVSDSDGPLGGVSIKIVGTKRGVVTDANGMFTIKAAANQTLMVSYLGYVTQEIPVHNETLFEITLVPDAAALDEVVVVGYGTQKKVNLTGAVAAISSEELTTRQAPNTTSLLQGRAPGVQITQNSGQPGAENANIQIRGMGTFSGAGNNPLILIDGVEGNLNNLNPNVIENISVLKDAASASIYGSRAANGVILVTTKSGRAGRLNIDYSYNYSRQKATSMYDRVTNSVQFMELLNKAINHTGTSSNQLYSDEQIEAYRQGSSIDPDRYPNYDWMDAVFRTAPMQQHFLSVNGGQDGTTYNFGLGYLSQEGMLIATGYKRYDAQLNFKTNLGGRVTFGTNISLSKGGRYETALNGNFDGNTTEDQILSALAANPTFKPKLPDGSGRYASKAYIFESGNKNPIAIAENGGKTTDNYYALASSYINVDILPGLKGELKGAVRYQDGQSKVHVVGIPAYLYQPDENGEYIYNTQYNGTVGENNLTVRGERELQLTYYLNFNYTKSFDNVHNISALLGYNQETFKYDRLQGFRRNAPTDNLTELDAYSSAGQIAEGQAYEWAIKSLYGRLNYNYKERYLFEANFRYDGTSRLPTGRRWGFFPSASIGWRLSEESFLKGSEWVNNLKIRFSWGQLGNQNIGNYPYQAILSPVEYNIGGALQQGMSLEDLNNTNLKWETTTATNIGLDFDLFKSSVFGSVDWYTKRTTDILRTLQVPDFIGLNGPTVNRGEMKNSGLEVLLGYQNRLNALNYKIQANFETYKNELVKFGAREIDNGSGLIRQEGLPYNSYFMYVFDGIYQTQEEIANGPTPISALTKPGDMRYKDISGPGGVPDGKIDANDRTVVDGAFPDFNYGLTFSADYKNFDFSFFVQGVEGRKIYVREWGIAPFRQSSPPPKFWLNAWDGPGTSNTIPHIFNENYAPNTQVSTWWLQDASYLRIKNIQVGYTLPNQLVNKIGFQRLRIYLSGDNLFTFTKFFDGGDPERLAANSRMAIYPQAKIYTMGIKAIL
ncbi:MULTISPECIES: SusC/RagA family TonB-linked outer membrane protein [Olivibacter]|uniref:SusC/RagA family TonB-linked outer membrane protein n=1 Tax=Olivibacter oleidegradans TaxID=760123 RepID=A0ABV6HSJ3_9SPHI|nr:MULTISPECIES: TonB-dependent receptor [Olivibacter]QEL01301.1 TonB-dependent receptor [Olivibacter sp. LS-1]